MFLKSTLLTSLVLLFSCSIAFASYPPPLSNHSEVTVINKTSNSIKDVVTKNNGTIMTSNPKSILPGSNIFKNKGNSWYPTGFRVQVGSNNNVNCVINTSLTKVSIQQNNNGVCHLINRNTVVIK